MKKIGILVNNNKVLVTLNKAYVEYIANAGYEPVLLNEFTSMDLIKTLDGLVLAGGSDINLTYYDFDNIYGKKVDSKRDNVERKILGYALSFGIPVFGICRGAQLLFLELKQDTCPIHNMIADMRFKQHIGTHNQADDSNGRSEVTHSIKANVQILYSDNSSDIWKKLYVNSMHHQGIYAKNINEITTKRVSGESYFEILAYTQYGLGESAIKEKISVLEGFRAQIGRNRICAVQWHPEELNDVNLLKSFFQ